MKLFDMVIFWALLRFPIPISLGRIGVPIYSCTHTYTHTQYTRAHPTQIVQLCQREVKKVALNSKCVSKEANVQFWVRRLMREETDEKVEREWRKARRKLLDRGRWTMR